MPLRRETERNQEQIRWICERMSQVATTGATGSSLIDAELLDGCKQFNHNEAIRQQGSFFIFLRPFSRSIVEEFDSMPLNCIGHQSGSL
jgi:hypothetical protein